VTTIALDHRSFQSTRATPSGDELPENLFFVFVNLPPNGEPPSYHVISRRDVARLVKEGHAVWLSTPGRGGKVRAMDNPIRKFKDAAGDYRDRWDLLGLDQDDELWATMIGATLAEPVISWIR
jgi:hypothetical protein